MSALGAPRAQPTDTLEFPSRAWFERLAALMNRNRARQEQLGYVDCVAQFRVLDAGPGGRPWCVQIVFEEFEAVEVRETGAGDDEGADFTLEAPLAVWREMIESIVDNGGRPDLEHTLNRLTHMGEPMRVVASDPLRRDCYFRFNQSLQEFVNACAAFRTVFRSAAEGAEPRS